MSEKKKPARRKTMAIIVPEDCTYYDGPHYDWELEMDDGTTLYVDCNENELYPGKLVVLKPIQRRTRGDEPFIDGSRTKYWVIDHDNDGSEQNLNN